MAGARGGTTILDINIADEYSLHRMRNHARKLTWHRSRPAKPLAAAKKLGLRPRPGWGRNCSPAAQQEAPQPYRLRGFLALVSWH